MARRKMTPGDRLVKSIEADMRDLGGEPDAKDRALLNTASRMTNRLAALEALIATEGLVIEGRANPALAECRQLELALQRVLGGIIISDDVRPKDPKKVRASQTRWRAHNEAKARYESIGADA